MRPGGREVHEGMKGSGISIAPNAPESAALEWQRFRQRIYPYSRLSRPCSILIYGLQFDVERDMIAKPFSREVRKVTQ